MADRRDLAVRGDPVPDQASRLEPAPLRPIRVLADDLTGAADSGVAFLTILAGGGYSPIQPLSAGSRPAAPSCPRLRPGPVRTSVDHGTAFDIAGTGVADARSMVNALRQAAALAPAPG
jgi:hypothetical protein